MTAPKTAKLDAGSSTSRFYRDHAEEYAKRTLAADISELYEPFLRLLKPGASILDIGCGAGRDILTFRRRGYDAWGIDESPELARFARELTGARVEISRIEDLDLPEAVDGIWACASLLHLSKAELPNALRRIRSALGASGVLFASMQKGASEHVSADGRFFALYKEPEFSSLVSGAGFELIETWTTGDSLPGRVGPLWINVLARTSA